MAEGKTEGESRFDTARAAALLAELRENFVAGKTRSFEWRAAQLKGFARMVEEKEAEIVQALHDDLAKSQLESFLGEVSLIKESYLFTMKGLKDWMKPQKVPNSGTAFPTSAKIVSEPLGVVLVISAWNYPFLLSIDPMLGAIAAGNAVVLKPSEIAPATSRLLARVIPEYIDNSCIRVVEGSIPETTALLEQQWDKIIYTGNARIGRIVMSAAAKHLTPVILELGGKSPVLVDPNVDLEVASKRIVAGKWGSNNGQACIAPDYIITTKSFAPVLVNALKTTLEKFYGKDPLGSPDLSRIVNSNHFARLTNLLDDKKVSGTVVSGGQRNEKLLKIAPTVLLDVPHDSLIMNEEIFGPLLPIITVNELQEGFGFINSRHKPLAAYLFTKDKQLEDQFVNTVFAGGMVINDTIIQVLNLHLPFGGVGESGMGSYHGKYSFDAFSHKKSVISRGLVGDISARYPPYTADKQKILRARETS